MTKFDAWFLTQSDLDWIGLDLDSGHIGLDITSKYISDI